MGTFDFEHSRERYEEAFLAVTSEFQVPGSFLVSPDHVAIKCADTGAFFDAIDEFVPRIMPGTLGEINQGGRRLASGELVDPIKLAGHTFGVVEIMEPRPGAEAQETFVEHTEFTVPNLLTVYNILCGKVGSGATDVRVVDQRQSHHPGIILEFGDRLEIKFNETSLVEMVEDEKRRHIWRGIKSGR
jgi:hypothetical protein